MINKRSKDSSDIDIFNQHDTQETQMPRAIYVCYLHMKSRLQSSRNGNLSAVLLFKQVTTNQVCLNVSAIHYQVPLFKSGFVLKLIDMTCMPTCETSQVGRFCS